MRRCKTVTVTRALATLTVALAVAASASGCSGDGEAAATTPPSASASSAPALPPATQLAARAALGRDQFYAASYRFIPADGAPAGTARVERTKGGVRVDLTQPADATRVERTTVVVQGPQGTFFCRLTAAARACVPGASRPAGEPDPRVQHAFSDWLEKLREPAAALSVTVASPPRGATGTCFSVEGIAASLDPPVDPGLYCFDTVGRITALRLGVGLLTVSEMVQAPPGVTLPAPVGAALPSAAVPSPTPTPSAPAGSVTPSPKGN